MIVVCMNCAECFLFIAGCHGFRLGNSGRKKQQKQYPSKKAFVNRPREYLCIFHGCG